MIRKGDMAPDFTLKGHDETHYTLSDFRGRKVVLLFYPADWSEFCTRQHACMVTDFPRFEVAGAQVFGISVDNFESHRAFAKHLGIRYPLLADFHPKALVSERYGVYHPDKGIDGRVTVVVGPDGRVTDVVDHGFPTIPGTAPLLKALDTP